MFDSEFYLLAVKYKNLAVKYIYIKKKKYFTCENINIGIVIFSKSGRFLNARKHIVEQAKKAMHLLFVRSNN